MAVVKMLDSGDIKVALFEKADEDLGSISYNRTYKMYDYKKLVELSKQGDLTPEKLKSAQDFDLVLHGETNLPFEPYNQVPPIRINQRVIYNVDLATEIKPESPTWSFEQ